MKVISLNIWNGRLPQELGLFFDKFCHDVDVFCFQEVFTAHNTRVQEKFIDSPKKIERVLGSGYRYVSDENGLMICYRNKFELLDNVVTEVFRKDGFKKNLLWAKFLLNGKEFLIGNVHGIWSKEGRSDSPERIRQSEIIKDVFDKENSSKILCGDFNLLPKTQSIQILEENMVNLIKKCNIPTTRTPLKKKTNLDQDSEEFADYIFVSEDLNVEEFKILDELVSDHYPLMLKFN